MFFQGLGFGKGSLKGREVEYEFEQKSRTKEDQNLKKDCQDKIVWGNIGGN